MELSREDKMIKQLCKTFKEDTDSYWLNTQRYIEVAAKYNFDPRRMQIKMEMLDLGVNEKIPSKKTIGRVMDYCRGLVRNNYKDPSITISTIKLLGEALCGDAYAFLIKIERENILKVGMEVQEIYGEGNLNHVYAMMNELIYWIAESQYYNYKPGTEENGEEFFEKKIWAIRKEIDNRFWNNREYCEKLHQLADDVEHLVCVCEIPGVAERWYKVNPKLRYFDCVFQFIEETPDLYQQIKQGKFNDEEGFQIGFCFDPDEAEIERQKQYFAEQKEKARRNHMKFSKTRLYQREVAAAFREMFRREFS